MTVFSNAFSQAARTLARAGAACVLSAVAFAAFPIRRKEQAFEH